MSYTIADIVQIVRGQLQGQATAQVVEHLVLDSRRNASPKNALFIAIKGEIHDGHDYIQEQYNNGFRAFLVEQHFTKFYLYPEAVFIVVQRGVAALQLLASHHRSQFEIPVLGITGSNGKTILKEWLYQMLSPDELIVRSPRSYNSQIGVPLSIWQMNAQHQSAIFEAGISLPGEMSKLRSMIQPTIGVFTNIGPAHDEGFRDLSDKIKEKLDLFSGVEKLFYCLDESVLHDAIISDQRLTAVQKVTWSRTNRNADLFIVQDQAKLRLSYQGQDFSLQLPFQDKASFHNACHLILICLDRGLVMDAIQERVSKLSSVAMRMDLKQGVNGSTIINDAYNTDLNALQMAMDFLNLHHQHGKKVVILSDILQTGKSSQALYSEVRQKIELNKVDQFIGIGSDIQVVGHINDCDTQYFPTTEDFLASFTSGSIRDAVVLIKGSRKFEFERISKRLELKSHDTILEINLNRLEENLNYFRSLLKPETKIIAMVKALSYGSGTYEIAHLLEYHRVGYLAVAYVDEGVELRKAGVRLPIMVLNPSIHAMNTMIKYSLEPEIYSLRVLKAFNLALSKSLFKDAGQFPIHIKLNTGMNRLGFDPKDLDDLLLELDQSKDVFVKSVYSHLAASEDPEQDDFTNGQVARFREMLAKIGSDLGYKPEMHILNSAGTQRFPGAQFDYVRIGIGMYGIDLVGDNLQHVSTLKSTISQIREVDMGESIGYGRKAIVDHNSRIATVAIGYADGLSRALGNGVGRMWLAGQYAPTIGNICMDMTMIDVTGIDCEEGDAVEVFGDHYTVTDMARDSNTIPYEVLTSVSHRVKRIFYHE